MLPTSVLATVTGRDRTGVTAAFFAALAAHDVDIRDVEQVVIRDRLVLTVLFDLRGDPGALRASAMTTAHALGMECEVTIADDSVGAHRLREGTRTHVIVRGWPLRPGALSHVAQRAADLGANIESITQLTGEPEESLELVVRAKDPARLRAALIQAAGDTGVDLAVEAAGLHRRAKRLVALDVATTLVRPGENGAGPQLVPGAAAFVQTLQRLGYRVGAVGGDETTARLTAELGLDFQSAGDDRSGALVAFADSFGVPLSQTVAAGDGTRNLDLLELAGLAVAVHPKIVAGRDSAPGLETVLFVLGVSDPKNPLIN